MTATEADPLVASLTELHGSFVTALQDVSDDALRRRPGALAPSIGFHPWHIARWADLFQARFPGFATGLARLGPNEQIWERDELAGT